MPPGGRSRRRGRSSHSNRSSSIAPNTTGQFAWMMRQSADAGSAPWVLFLHGNAATVASRVNIVRYEHLRSLGVNVFAPEYRGFGGLAGEPTESGVTEDASIAYRYLRETLRVPPGRIVIYGWSLGSAIAVNVASTVDSGALILEGAPASLVAIGAARVPVDADSAGDAKSIRIDRENRPHYRPEAVHSQPGRYDNPDRRRARALRRRARTEDLRRGPRRPHRSGRRRRRDDVRSGPRFPVPRLAASHRACRHALTAAASSSDTRARSSLPRSAAYDARCVHRSAAPTGACRASSAPDAARHAPSGPLSWSSRTRSSCREPR